MPDMVAIMDKYAENAMLKEGFDAKKLVITGNPNFDNLEENAKSFGDAEKQAVRKAIGINTDVLAFYAANVFKNEGREYGFWDLDNISIICECLDYSPNAGVAVKLHPRVPQTNQEKVSDYIEQKGKGRIKIISGISPHKISLASDVVFTPFSTVGIEAVIMGKPCISLQPGLTGTDHFSVMTENGLVDAGYTKDKCRILVAQSLKDENYRNMLKKKASGFRTDGKATERLVQLVYKMAA
jgi:UDP-N-acetylglucosamine 2-epimerase